MQERLCLIPKTVTVSAGGGEGREGMKSGGDQVIAVESFCLSSQPKNIEPYEEAKGIGEGVRSEAKHYLIIYLFIFFRRICNLVMKSKSQTIGINKIQNRMSNFFFLPRRKIPLKIVQTIR